MMFFLPTYLRINKTQFGKKQIPDFDISYVNPISTGGRGVFHPMPSEWLRTPQRSKLAP